MSFKLSFVVQVIVHYLDMLYYNYGDELAETVINDVIDDLLYKKFEHKVGDSSTDLYTFLCLMLGEYGTSPRYGWFSIEINEALKLFLKDYLKNRIEVRKLDN